MANENQQIGLMRRIPDIGIFRKSVSRMKIHLTVRHSMKKQDVVAGEKNPAEKAELAAKYAAKWPKSAAVIEKQIKEVFASVPAYQEMAQDPAQADAVEEICTDMRFCYFAYGFSAVEYFSFRLHGKGIRERSSFISSRLRMVYRCKMNDLLKADIFNDKTKTYAHFSKYFRREAIAISQPEDFPKFQEYVKAHPVFVKKQCFEAQGHSVELVNLAECGKSEQELFDSLIAQGKHILEERIVQSPEMAAFNESSVNTVRAITFVTRNGTVIPYCTLRTGRPGSFVDNGGAGGVQACIDFETGKIVTDGFDEIGGVYAAHPASGTVFSGYQLPDWEQLRALVQELAAVIPEIHFVGWDLAHTPDGWVMVEGNENCYIIAKQMIDDKGLRETFEGIMKTMDLVV